MDSANQVTSVLFVCLGNICRSPTAEGVFRQMANQRGLALNIDSAGTGGYHIGAAPDKRSQNAATARGYDLASLKCRRVSETDFENFDLIVPMDFQNRDDLLRKCPEQYQGKIKLMMSFTDSTFDEVPDPYYSGKKGFELVLDLIEQASDGILKSIS